jgi:hypothetical protein
VRDVDVEHGQLRTLPAEQTPPACDPSADDRIAGADYERPVIPDTAFSVDTVG